MPLSLSWKPNSWIFHGMVEECYLLEFLSSSCRVGVNL